MPIGVPKVPFATLFPGILLLFRPIGRVLLIR